MSKFCLQDICNTEVSKKIGVTPQCISQWISGKRLPSIKHLSKLTNIVKYPMNEVVDALLNANENYKNNALQKKKINN